MGRAQQLFAGEIDEDEAEEYGLPDVNTRQGDFGLNYYIGMDSRPRPVTAVASILMET